MVNNTVNGKKIGCAAGKTDLTIIVGTQIKQTERELKTTGRVNRSTIGNNFVVIKAYPGGNPNREEITH